MTPLRIYKDETYYTGWLRRQLSRIFPKEKQYRDFLVLRPTPLVRQRVFKYFTKVFEHAGDDVKKALQDNTFLFRDMLELLPKFAIWLDSMDLLTGFCAAVLCPVGQTIDNKDDDEIYDYLAHNSDLKQEVKVVHDFFYLVHFGEIAAMYLSIKSVITRSLTTAKKPTNPLPD